MLGQTSTMMPTAMPSRLGDDEPAALAVRLRDVNA